MAVTEHAMRPISLLSIPLVLAIATSLVGCSSDDSTGSYGGGVGNGGGSTKRSNTCLKTLNALCDRTADWCQQTDRATCDETAQALFCKSDALVQDCLDALSGATCSGLPTACQNIVDREPAVQLCKRLSESHCSAVARCGGNKTECLTELASSLPCNFAVGAALSIDTCLAALDSAMCPASGSAPMQPTSCKGVIKMNTQSLVETPGLNVTGAALSNLSTAASFF